MKLKKILLYISIFLSVSLSGCILDSLNEVPLDIPITYTFNATGDANTIMDDGTFCLDDNALYSDYEAKMKDIKLLEITFRPTEVTPSSTKGDLRLVIRKNNNLGEVLVNQPFPDITPGSYVAPNLPYKLLIDAVAMNAVNEYLKASGTCFYVAVSVENVTPAGTKTVKGQVDFVFRSNTDLGG